MTTSKNMASIFEAIYGAGEPVPEGYLYVALGFANNERGLEEFQEAVSNLERRKMIKRHSNRTISLTRYGVMFAEGVRKAVDGDVPPTPRQHWQKGNYRILTVSGWEDVSGYTSGHWGVAPMKEHEPRGPWVLTHTPSGYGILHAATQQIAQRAAEVLDAVGVNLGADRSARDMRTGATVAAFVQDTGTLVDTDTIRAVAEQAWNEAK